jgi:hypothetical protein
MKRTIWASAIIALAGITATSCKEDKEAPLITINSPTTTDGYHWGDTIHASVTIEDNKNLYSFQIYIGELNGNASEDWPFSITNNLSGKEYTWEQDLVVPDSVPTNLWLHCKATDAATLTSTQNVKMWFEP